MAGTSNTYDTYLTQALAWMDKAFESKVDTTKSEEDKRFFIDRHRLINEIKNAQIDHNSNDSEASQIHNKISDLKKLLKDARAQEYKINQGEIQKIEAALDLFFCTKYKTNLHGGQLGLNSDKLDLPVTLETNLSDAGDTKTLEQIQRYEQIYQSNKLIDQKDMKWGKDAAGNPVLSTTTNPVALFHNKYFMETDHTSPLSLKVSHLHRSTAGLFLGDVADAANAKFCALNLTVTINEEGGTKERSHQLGYPLPKEVRRKLSDDAARKIYINIAIKDCNQITDPYERTLAVYKLLLQREAKAVGSKSHKGSAEFFLNQQLEVNPSPFYRVNLLKAAEKEKATNPGLYDKLGKSLFTDPKQANYWLHHKTAKDLFNSYESLEIGHKHIPSKDKETFKAKLDSIKDKLVRLNNHLSHPTVDEATQAKHFPYDPAAIEQEIALYDTQLKDLKTELDQLLAKKDEKVTIEIDEDGNLNNPTPKSTNPFDDVEDKSQPNNNQLNNNINSPKNITENYNPFINEQDSSAIQDPDILRKTLLDKFGDDPFNQIKSPEIHDLDNIEDPKLIDFSDEVNPQPNNNNSSKNTTGKKSTNPFNEDVNDNQIKNGNNNLNQINPQNDGIQNNLNNIQENDLFNQLLERDKKHNEEKEKRLEEYNKLKEKIEEERKNRNDLDDLDDQNNQNNQNDFKIEKPIKKEVQNENKNQEPTCKYVKPPRYPLKTWENLDLRPKNCDEVKLNKDLTNPTPIINNESKGSDINENNGSHITKINKVIRKETTKFVEDCKLNNELNKNETENIPPKDLKENTKEKKPNFFTDVGKVFQGIDKKLGQVRNDIGKVINKTKKNKKEGENPTFTKTFGGGNEDL